MRAQDLDKPSLDRLLSAVRAWGDTTHGDYRGKVAALLSLRDVCATFTRPAPWLYRGTGCTMQQMKVLREGGEIVMDDRPMLSWTHDIDTAQQFADGSLMGEMLLVEMQGLTPFFDYELFGEYLDSIGYDYHDDESLTDPIREQEVIVWTAEPIRITIDDINDLYQ